jgi:nitroreductase
MDLFTAIETRASAGRVSAPGPTSEDLARILAAAGRAPDHGRMKPWHLVVLEGAVRERFAAAAAEAKRRRTASMSDEQLAAEREKMLRSPTLVCTVRENPKVPEIEQVVAAGAAAENLFLAAHDLGYGVMWKTGAAAYDADVKAVVGLKATDHIVAIMHLGTRVK